MATLEKIRSRASLMIFVIACALLCFIVGDFLNNSFSILHRNENVVGVVNGEKIDRFEFEDSYRQLSEVFKYQQRNQAEDAEIRAAAFENFKQKVLINSEAQADGLAVTKGELTDATIGNHPHSLLLRSGFFVNQNGVFSSDIVKRFIDDVNRDPNTISNPDERAQFMARQEQVRNIWLYTENTVKQSLLVDKIGALLNNALSAPKAEADFIAALSSKESDALVARKLFADVNDADVQVADADLLAYYNAHKNDFKRESYRNMQIIMFPIGPSKQDLKEEFDVMDSLRSQLRSTSDNEKLQLLFQSSSERNYQFSNVYITPNSYDPAFTEFAKTATSGQVSDIVSDEMQGLFKCAKALANPVTRPDSVRFSLIAVQEADTVATQARADSIAKAARTGADFAKLASSLSKDPNVARTGGDQGWITEGVVGLKDFDDKAFNSAVGNVFVINNGPASFVIKVTELTKPVLKAKISILATRMEPSTATTDSIDQVCTEFLVENKTADAFVKSAKEKGYMLRPLTNLTRNQPSTYVLPHSRGLIKWAFESQEGAVSDIFTEVPDQYIIAALTDVVDAEDGFVPFEKVKEQISNIVLNQKKAEKLAAEMNGKQLAEIGSVDTITAVSLSSNYLSKIGSEAAVAGAVVAAQAGAPAKVVKGRSGVYAFQKIAERDVTASASADALQRDIRNAVNGSLMKAMEDKAEIENDSYKVY